MTKSAYSIITCRGARTRQWAAWHDRMPPGPGHLHVVGEVEVPNPGVWPVLVPRQGDPPAPEILVLDLLLIQQDGIWPEVMTWRTARYDEVMTEKTYARVQIMCGSDRIADEPIGDVS